MKIAFFPENKNSLAKEKALKTRLNYVGNIIYRIILT